MRCMGGRMVKNNSDDTLGGDGGGEGIQPVALRVSTPSFEDNRRTRAHHVPPRQGPPWLVSRSGITVLLRIPSFFCPLSCVHAHNRRLLGASATVTQPLAVLRNRSGPPVFTTLPARPAPDVERLVPYGTLTGHTDTQSDTDSEGYIEPEDTDVGWR